MISLSSANTRELFHHSRRPRKTDVNPNTTSELLVKPLNNYSIALSRHTEFEILLDTVNTHTHTRLTALFPGLPEWADTRKVKLI